MMFSSNNIAKYILTLALLIASLGALHAQSQMRVQGVVTSTADGKPVERVAITSNYIFKAYTDIDGKFSILVAPDAELEFYHAEFEDTKIAVNGRQTLQVQMVGKVVAIEEIVVTSKVKTKAITVEPTDIEIKGNYFHLKTKFRVPHTQMKTDYRFVVQPIVHDVTLNKFRNLRPVVIDGHNYDIVQHRYHNFGNTIDSLEPFIVPNTIEKGNDVYAYKDSLYVVSKELDNDYKADCYMVMVTYRRPIDFDEQVKVVTIANGTVNPMRLFEYDIKPMQLDGSLIEDDKVPYLEPTGSDTIYIPTPEMELRNSAGAAKIEFDINKTTVNLKNPTNKANVDKIKNILREVQSNPDATLKAISMTGYASPDGKYEKNKSLADARTKGMLDMMSEVIDASRLKFIDMSYEGVVEPWSSLVKLTKDRDPEISQKIADIIDKTGDRFPESGYRIARLPEYRKVIVPNYLPDLRRVEYRIDYSIFRPLTFDEIKELHSEGDSLSRHEYYQLVVGEQDSVLKAKFEAEAINRYPNFMLFVNRKAVDMIQHDSVNMDILAPLFSGTRTPTAVKYNQAIMALRNNEIAVADSLTQSIVLDDTTRHLHNIVQVLNGEYEKVYHYFRAQGGLNEVLLLLSMKRNEEAYEKMQLLMTTEESVNNARFYYVLAVCANRLDDFLVAMENLQLAITLDPSLEEMAKIDSDVLDVYDLIRTDVEQEPYDQQ